MSTLRRLGLFLVCCAIAACRPLAIDSTSSPPLSSSPASTPLTSPTTASASPSPMPTPDRSTTAVDCDNPSTPAAANRCAELAYQVADAQLNQVYQDFKATLSSAEQAQLTEVEQAWIAFRDRRCDFESSQAKEAAIQPGVRDRCLEAATKARTAELKAQAQEPL